MGVPEGRAVSTPICLSRRGWGVKAALTVAATLGLTTGAGAQALPPSWLKADVGSPAAPGTATQSAGNFSVSSRGWDINGASDQFTFAYVSVRGDVTLVAKLDSLQNVDPGSLAGVMIRESLNANSNHVSMLGSAGSGLVSRARASNRGGTSEVRAASYTVPVWVRVDRRGTALASYRSTDGLTWSPVSNVKVKFSQTVLVGMAVASHSSLTSTSARFNSVTINGVAVPAPEPLTNVPPTVSLSSLGDGATFTAPASISMGATAADSDGTVAKVEFFNGTTLLGTDTTSPYTFSWGNVAAGSYTLKAVATDNAGASATSTAVTVTVNANTPPAVSLTSPAAGTSFMAPASTTVAATATDAGGSIVRVDFYAGATLLSSDTTSPYSVSWSNVPAGSYVLTAKATDNAGASTTSVGVSVTVNANQAPTVSLTSPTTGSNFNAPATITLTASASDVDGSIQKVDFYNGSTLLGTSTTSPFTLNWQNVAAGSYSLSAMASDNQGATTASSWSDVTVGSTILSKAIFTPAVVPDTVDYYVFEVYTGGADPAVAAPLATQNLGIPPVVNGEMTVDVRSTISGLAPGSYIATVSSMSTGEGTLRSAPFTFTR
jgi:regulation of enolase protein 1 (concanavalin A-like superfamily)